MVMDYSQTRKQAEDVLRQAFPNAAIVTDEGWHGRVHVKIISPVFNERTEREKQDIIWNVLNEKMREEAQGISLVLAYGTDEV